MVSYCQAVRDLEDKFHDLELHHVLRDYNKAADVLAKTVSSHSPVVDGVQSYQSSYGFASGQIPRRSQRTLLPSSGGPKVSNPWNNVQRKDSIS
jgi:hypothetical protein